MTREEGERILALARAYLLAFRKARADASLRMKCFEAECALLEAIQRLEAGHHVRNRRL